MAKGTAKNAKNIEIQMQAAAAHLAEALKAVRAASEAVKTGENEVDMKMPEFFNLAGLLSIAHGTANRTAATWGEYAIARENR